jgi:CTP synthase
LVPYLEISGELKTKPTQHSVKELRSIGIQPDVIVCRTERLLSNDMKDKISLFCNVPKGAVIQNVDAEVLYEVPLMLENEGFADIVCKRLNIVCDKPELSLWKEMVSRQKNASSEVKIALVGKYVELHDAYLSVSEALYHGGILNDCNVVIDWINSEKISEKSVEDLLKDADGILVPGGFGDRGIEGKIMAVKYARENKVPFFGICLGMQLAVAEYARNVGKMVDAHSSEFEPDTKHPVIDIMPDQKDLDEKGGTMRLGIYPCKIVENTKAHEIYECDLIYERHRHRYEFNNEFKDELEASGMVFSGISPDGKLVEMIELKEHPWFVGVQFHPEFKSRPNNPHILFSGFIGASLACRK